MQIFPWRFPPALLAALTLMLPASGLTALPQKAAEARLDRSLLAAAALIRDFHRAREHEREGAIESAARLYRHVLFRAAALENGDGAIREGGGLSVFASCRRALFQLASAHGSPARSKRAGSVMDDEFAPLELEAAASKGALFALAVDPFAEPFADEALVRLAADATRRGDHESALRWSGLVPEARREEIELREAGCPPWSGFGERLWFRSRKAADPLVLVPGRRADRLLFVQYGLLQLLEFAGTERNGSNCKLPTLPQAASLELLADDRFVVLVAHERGTARIFIREATALAQGDWHETTLRGPHSFCVNPSAAVHLAGHRLYVPVRSRDTRGRSQLSILCLDLERGRRVAWQSRHLGPATESGGSLAAIGRAGGYLAVDTGRGVAALLCAESGLLEWAVPYPTPEARETTSKQEAFAAAPLATEGSIYFGPPDSSFLRLDMRSGRQLGRSTGVQGRAKLIHAESKVLQVLANGEQLRVRSLGSPSKQLPALRGSSPVGNAAGLLVPTQEGLSLYRSGQVLPPRAWPEGVRVAEGSEPRVDVGFHVCVISTQQQLAIHSNS